MRHPTIRRTQTTRSTSIIDETRVIDGALRRQFPRAGSTTLCAQLRGRRAWDGRFIKALRNIKAGEELNYDYGLIIDERYTPKLKAEYPAVAAPASAAAPLLAPKRRSARGD